MAYYYRISVAQIEIYMRYYKELVFLNDKIVINRINLQRD